MRVTAAFALLLAVGLAAAFVLTRDGSSGDDGGAVTLVGDSLNVGVEPYLRDALPGWTIEAHDRVGRATAEGVDVLRGLGARLAPVVVVSLGTNDPEGSEAAFRRLVDEAIAIAGTRCVVWATVVRGGVGRAGFDRVLQDARSAHPNLRLVDWTRMVGEDDSLLAADVVHATPDGYARRADEIARVVRGCSS